MAIELSKKTILKCAVTIIIFLFFVISNYISNKNFVSSLKGESQKLN